MIPYNDPRSKPSLAINVTIAVFVCIALVCGSPLTGVDTDAIQRWEAKIKSTIEKMNRNIVSLGDGSGVIVDKNELVLSVAHLFEGPNQEINLRGPMGDSTGAARGMTIGIHRPFDLAVLRIIRDQAVQTAEAPVWGEVLVKSASELPVNTPVIALGYPAGWPKDALPLPRLGTIRGVNKHSVVTSAKIMGGDSGGGLFDLDGRLIAINASAGSSADRNYHINIQRFANHRRRLLAGGNISPEDDLKRERDRSGSLRNVPELPANELNQDNAYLGLVAETDQSRLRVRSVNVGSPAALVGLKPKDVIRSINGTSLTSFIELRNKLSSLRPGETVLIELNRFGKLYRTQATLGRSRTGTATRTATPSSNGQPNQILDAIKQLATQERSVVEMVSENETIALGTVLSSQGLIVTKASELTPKGWRVRLPNGQHTEGKLLATDTRNDLALLRIDANIIATSDIDPISFATPSTKLIERASNDGSNDDAFATSTAKAAIDLRPGSLLYSVPASPKSNPVFGILGASLDDWRPADASLSGPRGTGIKGRFNAVQRTFYVTSVLPRTPAESAQILAGDHIHYFAGSLENASHCERRFDRLEPGEVVQCKLSRAGKELQLELKKPRIAAHSSLDQWAGGPYSRRRFGLGSVMIHDLPLHPAMCGGPLRNSTGDVVGINIARCTRSISAAKPLGIVVQFVLDRGFATELHPPALDLRR